MLAHGLSTREIGEPLRLSPNTVKSLTRSPFTKFDVHNRVQALVIGRERGLICPPWTPVALPPPVNRF